MIFAAFLQLDLDLADEGDGHAGLELVGRRVEIQYLDDLIGAELVAHLADRVDVLVEFAGLQ